ncbi:glycosyltransferase [Massilia arenosa]|uniref:Glycosyltransferase n=1 Tax=Zemynaea arenosa TaxID=2561931 RepID=A0A4Y9S0F6_9BURK|nr:glycosyltransferase [Massilia arenosa]TFW14752.1 glycosyltransferase [Massilia arenosa]
MATFNGASTLPKVLEAYCRLEPPDGGWVLRIVDDGSTDTTADLLASYRDRLPLQLLHKPRGGKSAALNLALECALREDSSHLFVFTDDDATPDADWLVQLDACARVRCDYAIFGGAIVPDWEVTPPAWILRQVPLGLTYGITACNEGPVFPGLAWGANMAVRREVFAEGHRFDIKVGPTAGQYAMGSETEFTRRIASHGYKAWFCEKARVAHRIRAHQLTRAWVLERARRFGRGARRQEVPDGSKRLFGVPRWMYARYAAECAGGLRSWLARDLERGFRHAWERAHLAGYITQAWRGAQPPKVLLTSVSGGLGGMELRMAQEARVLARSGYRSMLAVPRFRGTGQLAAELESYGVPLRVFDPPQFLEHWNWRRARKLGAQLAGVPRMRMLRPDLVHVAFCWTSYGASLLWMAARSGKPCVISVHNAFPQMEMAAWQAPMYRAAFRAVRGVYAVSESALDHFLKTYAPLLAPATRLAVIPNSVDARRFLPCTIRRAAARQRYLIPSDALVLGSVARLAPQKRPHLLLDLLAALRPRFPSLYLLLVGAGPLESEVKAAVQERGLQDFVRFAGHVEAVEDVMPALDLHLLLSRNEGFGISTIEAMSCCVPAIGTDVPGTADVLGGSCGGLLVPADDAHILRETVGSLLDDPLRRVYMGRCGRAEVQAKYTPELLEQRTRDFYAGLLP